LFGNYFKGLERGFFPPPPPPMQTDAEYVDVIHSNGDSLIIGGLGAWEPIGRLLLHTIQNIVNCMCFKVRAEFLMQPKRDLFASF